jgi:hypothetical protein
VTSYAVTQLAQTTDCGPHELSKRSLIDEVHLVLIDESGLFTPFLHFFLIFYAILHGAKPEKEDKSSGSGAAVSPYVPLLQQLRRQVVELVKRTAAVDAKVAAAMEQAIKQLPIVN